jgi:hypothetical protein
MTRFYLREIAHARSGDKGDTSNIGLIAYRAHYYPILLEQVTATRVKAHFRSLARGPVTRYELPLVHALNFVLENALGGGVTRSLSLDPHGKSYSALLLTLTIDADDAITQELLDAGRRPVSR